MSQLFDPVFGDWYTETQLGSGTDGKAFTIVRTDETGKKHRAVLKTIRVGDYRNEKKSFNKLGEAPQPAGEDTLREKIIRNIVQVLFIRPKQRPFQTNNFYAVLERQDSLDKEVFAIVSGKEAHKSREKAD